MSCFGLSSRKQVPANEEEELGYRGSGANGSDRREAAHPHRRSLPSIFGEKEDISKAASIHKRAPAEVRDWAGVEAPIGKGTNGIVPRPPLAEREGARQRPRPLSGAGERRSNPAGAPRSVESGEKQIPDAPGGKLITGEAPLAVRLQHLQMQNAMTDSQRAASAAKPASKEPGTGSGTGTGKPQKPSPAMHVIHSGKEYYQLATAIRPLARRDPSPATRPNLPVPTTLDMQASEFHRLYHDRLADLSSFTYNELRAATRNFASELLLGVGGFGAVYKGLIRPPTRRNTETSRKNGSPAPVNTYLEVAVKKLDAKSQQGHKEWMTEVSFLGLIEHEHLVKLVGYCAEADRRLLVYEFLPNSSLDRFLFGNEKAVLEWAVRVKVALATAKGLAYLHEEVEPQVIYRDFKTSNVLLDWDFTPKLSDFGLAREGLSGEETHVSTQVRGTAGYAAPEYMLTGHLTPKNDVWSFGVVLLELLTGRPCLDRQRPAHEHNLVHYCRPYLSNPAKLRKVMDPRLRGRFPMRGMAVVGELARWCLVSDQTGRPRMSEVVEVLRSIDENELEGMEEEGEEGGGAGGGGGESGGEIEEEERPRSVSVQ